MTLPGARFCNLANRSFLSLMRRARSNGTGLSRTRRNLAAAKVSNAAAWTNVGRIVHVGSCLDGFMGRTQLAVWV